MAKITIDGKDYELDDLPEGVLPQIQSIRFVDSEVTRCNAKIAALRTARNAYAMAVKSLLDPNSQGEAAEIADTDESSGNVEFD